MNNYIVSEESKNLILEIDTKLNLLEVKGDSVMHLSSVRLMIKKLYDSIKEEVQVKESETTEGS